MADIDIGCGGPVCPIRDLEQDYRSSKLMGLLNDQRKRPKFIDNIDRMKRSITNITPRVEDLDGSYLGVKSRSVFNIQKMGNPHGYDTQKHITKDISWKTHDQADMTTRSEQWRYDNYAYHPETQGIMKTAVPEEEMYRAGRKAGIRDRGTRLFFKDMTGKFIGGMKANVENIVIGRPVETEHLKGNKEYTARSSAVSTEQVKLQHAKHSGLDNRSVMAANQGGVVQGINIQGPKHTITERQMVSKADVQSVLLMKELINAYVYDLPNDCILGTLRTINLDTSHVLRGVQTGTFGQARIDDPPPHRDVVRSRVVGKYTGHGSGITRDGHRVVGGKTSRLVMKNDMRKNTSAYTASGSAIAGARDIASNQVMTLDTTPQKAQMPKRITFGENRPSTRGATYDTLL